jgi:hypothetical protein
MDKILNNYIIKLNNKEGQKGGQEELYIYIDDEPSKKCNTNIILENKIKIYKELLQSEKQIYSIIDNIILKHIDICEPVSKISGGEYNIKIKFKGYISTHIKLPIISIDGDAYIEKNTNNLYISSNNEWFEVGKIHLINTEINSILKLENNNNLSLRDYLLELQKIHGPIKIKENIQIGGELNIEISDTPRKKCKVNIIKLEQEAKELEDEIIKQKILSKDDLNFIDKLEKKIISNKEIIIKLICAEDDINLIPELLDTIEEKLKNKKQINITKINEIKNVIKIKCNDTIKGGLITDNFKNNYKDKSSIQCKTKLYDIAIKKGISPEIIKQKINKIVKLNDEIEEHEIIIDELIDIVEKEKCIIKPIPGPTGSITVPIPILITEPINSIPGPTGSITVPIPGPTGTINLIAIPGPTGSITVPIPGPTGTINLIAVPGPTGSITVPIPGPTGSINLIAVPGPTGSMPIIEPIPGPTGTIPITVPIPGPTGSFPI